MRKAPLAIIAALLLTTPVLAGWGEKGEWEFGPYGGYGWPDDYEMLEPDDDVIFGGRVAYWFSDRQSFEGSFQRFASTVDEDPNGAPLDLDFNIDSARLNYMWNFFAGERIRPFLTAGAGYELADLEDGFDSADLGINVGAGYRSFLTEHFGLRLDVRYVFTDVGDVIDSAQGNVESTLGLVFAFGGGPPPDADGDGVPDRKDKCPDTPKGATVDINGCPGDSDGDGVYNGLDKCPDTPKGWPVDAQGCPKDTDGDKVADGADSCPNTPTGARVDAKGCPMDSDGDGVPDGLDKCPDTPRGARVDTTGCPTDGDKDGVSDGLDQCPDSKPGVKVDEKGCEIIVKAPQLFEMEKKTLVLEGVHFEVNKAELTPDSLTVLDMVAASLKDWPEVKVEIGGHTDSTGGTKHNLELSQKRAEAVQAYLVSRGVDASRLAAKGYGKAKPVADNKTAEGKTKNRRVELTRTDQ